MLLLKFSQAGIFISLMYRLLTENSHCLGRLDLYLAVDYIIELSNLNLKKTK